MPITKIALDENLKEVSRVTADSVPRPGMRKVGDRDYQWKLVEWQIAFQLPNRGVALFGTILGSEMNHGAPNIQDAGFLTLDSSVKAHQLIDMFQNSSQWVNTAVTEVKPSVFVCARLTIKKQQFGGPPIANPYLGMALDFIQ